MNAKHQKVTKNKALRAGMLCGDNARNGDLTILNTSSILVMNWNEVSDLPAHKNFVVSRQKFETKFDRTNYTHPDWRGEKLLADI